jgi:hypothetical protein
MSMKDKQRPVEPSLPATIKFVTAIGLFLTIGWLLMFWLLVNRW